MSEPRKTVFVSYAHEDRKWAEELQKHLAPWIRGKRVSMWDDSRIGAGSRWEDEIRHAIEEATVAVLLVSPDFLASDFIVNVELPLILQQAKKKRLRIAWLAVRHSAVESTPLWQFQALKDPSHPLDSVPRPEREKLMVDAAKAIADAASIATFAEGLRLIDETVEPLAAATEKRGEVSGRAFSVQAHYEPGDDRISFTGASTVITVADLDKLPPKDREFLAELEDSMDRNYKRWIAVRKKRGGAGGALDDEIEEEMKRVGRLMCEDLNAILEFLRTMHKGELEDHYGSYRYICSKLTAA